MAQRRAAAIFAPTRLAGFFAALLWAGAAAPQGAPPALDGVAPLQSLKFDVVRDGKVIGHHDVSFRKDGDRLVVDIDVSIKVDAMFVTVFRYAQKREEVWRGDRLASFTSHTNDDGEIYDMTGAVDGQGIKITSGAASWVVPANSVPIGYWDTEMVKRGPLLDTVTGKPVVAGAKAVGQDTIDAAGRKITATHYLFEGPQPRELWYDAQGHWVKMRTRAQDGSTADWVLKSLGS